MNFASFKFPGYRNGTKFLIPTYTQIKFGIEFVEYPAPDEDTEFITGVLIVIKTLRPVKIEFIGSGNISHVPKGRWETSADQCNPRRINLNIGVNAFELLLSALV
jgi:hypothetical protein